MTLRNELVTLKVRPTAQLAASTLIDKVSRNCSQTHKYQFSRLSLRID